MLISVTYITIRFHGSLVYIVYYYVGANGTLVHNIILLHDEQFASN